MQKESEEEINPFQIRYFVSRIYQDYFIEHFEIKETHSEFTISILFSENSSLDFQKNNIYLRKDDNTKYFKEFNVQPAKYMLSCGSRKTEQYYLAQIFEIQDEDRVKNLYPMFWFENVDILAFTFKRMEIKNIIDQIQLKVVDKKKEELKILDLGNIYKLELNQNKRYIMIFTLENQEIIQREILWRNFITPTIIGHSKKEGTVELKPLGYDKLISKFKWIHFDIEYENGKIFRNLEFQSFKVFYDPTFTISIKPFGKYTLFIHVNDYPPFEISSEFSMKKYEENILRNGGFLEFETKVYRGIDNVYFFLNYDFEYHFYYDQYNWDGYDSTVRKKEEFNFEFLNLNHDKIDFIVDNKVKKLERLQDSRWKLIYGANIYISKYPYIFLTILPCNDILWSFKSHDIHFTFMTGGKT